MSLLSVANDKHYLYSRNKSMGIDCCSSGYIDALYKLFQYQCKLGCGIFLSNTIIEQEEAIAITCSITISDTLNTCNTIITIES